MNITLLIRRALKREGGEEEVNEPQARDFISALNDQLNADTGGNYDLYASIRALKEVPEAVDEDTTG